MRHGIGWRCNQAEDVALVRELGSSSAMHAHELRKASRGFLMVTNGRAARDAGAVSAACLREATGWEVMVRELQLPCALEPKPRKQSSRGSRSCFGTLMRLKMEAARASPFDLTALVDTDVYPNRSLLRQLGTGALTQALNYGSLLAEAEVVMPYGPLRPESASGVPLIPPPFFNTGLIFFRKGNATDRFFACVAAQVHRTAAPSIERSRGSSLVLASSLIGQCLRYREGGPEGDL